MSVKTKYTTIFGYVGRLVASTVHLYIKCGSHSEIDGT